MSVTLQIYAQLLPFNKSIWNTFNSLLIWIGIVNLVKCNFNWKLENTDDYIFLLIKNGTGCISAIVCSGVSALMEKKLLQR